MLILNQINQVLFSVSPQPSEILIQNNDQDFAQLENHLIKFQPSLRTSSRCRSSSAPNGQTDTHKPQAVQFSILT